MIGRILPVLLTCCVAGCAGQQTGEIRAATIVPEGCNAVGTVWKLKVRYDDAGAPVGVDADSGNERPIRDPERLEVAECDNVRFNVNRGARSRSAMIFFDKDPAFRTPGKKPAYLSRRGAVFVPIDNRDTRGREEYAYSIHVDCPEVDSQCAPLDPIIVVER
jgi:hypothetical protein